MLRAQRLGKECLELLAHLAYVILATGDLDDNFVSGADDFKTEGTGDGADAHQELFGGVLANRCLTRQRDVNLDQRTCIFKAIRLRFLNRFWWAGREVVTLYEGIKAISQ